MCGFPFLCGVLGWEPGLAPAAQAWRPAPRLQVDHAAAVKEYSRSSADQEEPLPHELRPSAVLSRTMDYLVTHIMDQKEGSLRDWYDFVWNRTRGIRKVPLLRRLAMHVNRQSRLAHLLPLTCCVSYV